MNKIIQDKLIEIEEMFQIKILYAVEAGSRAWGIPSKGSDYDVRFIYIHRPEWYLSIDPQGIGGKKDVIELPINELLDISGWEVTKALRLFRKSNPSLLEWLRSNMIYSQKYPLVEQLRELEAEHFNSRACLYHYLHMAKRNNRNLKGPKVDIKKYFNTLRPLLACKWIEEYNTFPPIDFHELVQHMIPEGAIKSEIEDLVKRKIRDHTYIDSSNQVIHEFYESELNRIEAYIKTIKVELVDPTKKLDQLFRNILKEVCG